MRVDVRAGRVGRGRRRRRAVQTVNEGLRRVLLGRLRVDVHKRGR